MLQNRLNTVFAKLETLTPPITSGKSRLHWGLVLAVVAHLTLLLILPDIPELQFKLIGRSGGINVFLTETNKTEEKQFEQTLNQPSRLPTADQPLIEPAVGSATPDPGDESSVTESAPQVTAQSGESDNKKAQGKESKVNIKPEILTSRAMIARFSQQQAVLYANLNPDNLERFRRTFNSYRSYQRRNQRKSYKSLYGDYYAKSSSSVGDVCYKQQREIRQDEFSTKTVYFFRCDQKPKEFKIDLKPVPES